MKMFPSPFDSSGNTFTVWCKRCGRPCNSSDVEAALDEAAGSFYCQDCFLFRGTQHPVLDGSKMTPFEFEQYKSNRVKVLLNRIS